MILRMIHRQIGFAGLACALSLGVSLSVQAQNPSSTTTQDQTTTTRTHSYDSSGWQAPRGYELAYPENGSPNMVARQGYAAGFSQGEADHGRSKKFKPTDSDAYKDAKIPKGMDKHQFKEQFREAFVKGYSNGFKGE
ncbi:MAG TPA: hypothetical protein VND90_03440 [Terracidiphilus sp.]|nr:hypothetical protein [Terracidiphilus sp.]